MKVKILKKATPTKKPANYCPWMVDDYAPEKK